MRKISVKDANKEALGGSKVYRAAPAAKVKDYGPEISLLKSKVLSLGLAIDSLSSVPSDEVGNHAKILEHLNHEITALKAKVDDMSRPPTMAFRRGPQGYLAEISCNGKTYKLNRNQAGFVESVTTIGRG